MNFLKNLLRRFGLVDVARFLLLRVFVVEHWLVRIGLLKYRWIGHGSLVQMGNAALSRSRHGLAMEAYLAALSRTPEDVLLRLQIGVTAYLVGDYQEAERWFVSCQESRHFDLSRWGIVDPPYRVLDHTWMLAIGHIAFLDTYVKTILLNWMPEKIALLAFSPGKPPAGWPLFRYFSQYIKIIPSSKPNDAVDEIIHGPDFTDIDGSSRSYIRAALSQPFWYATDNTGRTRWFAPHAALVEAEWKAQGRGPLIAPTASDVTLFRKTMWDVYGLPPDAWFVVLHVREPGYHAKWHKHHPATRNADIRTYAKVVDFIIAQGGWVVRGGDPTMVPITPHPKVIDYALSDYRSPEIDILLCSECAYLVGTNSGFSLVPPVFGKRCALTNWSPIGTPNWYLDDIVMPKLVRRRADRRHLTFAEMYSSVAGWSQFQRDFNETNMIIEDNDPDDLLMVVEELHGEVFGTSPPPNAADEARLQKFNDIVVAHRGYVGSRMSYRFLAKYEHLLDWPDAPNAVPYSKKMNSKSPV